MKISTQHRASLWSHCQVSKADHFLFHGKVYGPKKEVNTLIHYSAVYSYLNNISGLFRVSFRSILSLCVHFEPILEQFCTIFEVKSGVGTFRLIFGLMILGRSLFKQIAKFSTKTKQHYSFIHNLSICSIAYNLLS